MPQFYDGTKLLSLLDLNGEKPEIYISTSNRSAGKTTYFNRWFVKRFLENKEEFVLLYRYDYEISDVANKFFGEIKNLFFPGKEMKSKSRAKGVYHELLLDNATCGYALSLNKADALKKMSHIFGNVQRILFDEFQSESGNYCQNEIKKFQSVHTTIARGGGKQVRYVPVYMISNLVSLINPYYVNLGIADRLKNDTVYLRGNGYVLEQSFYEGTAQLQKNSAFNRAFANSDYTRFNTQKIYLSDKDAFIEKPSGKSRYLCTLKYDGNCYGIREYPEEGIIYCDNTYDANHPTKIVVTTADHEINYVMLKRNDLLIGTLRQFYENGCFRFKNQMCKQAVLCALSYQ